MRHSALLFQIAAAGLAFAAPASAQTPDPAPGDAEPAFGLPSGIVPEAIFGVPCTFDPGDANFAPNLRCLPDDMINQPSIAVTIKTLAAPQTRAEMEAFFREGLHERAILRVSDKGDFTLASDPESVGFKALYQTDLGNRYVWSVYSRGRKILAVATILAPLDLDALVSEVEAKVFTAPQP